MNRKTCPQCGASKTKKNGTRNGVQLYTCLVCQHQFRSGKFEHSTDLWNAYQNHKQTVQQLAELHNISPYSVKRQLQGAERIWEQPSLVGQSGYIHLDVTYWGHNWGVLLALDDATNTPLIWRLLRVKQRMIIVLRLTISLPPDLPYGELSLMARKHCLRSSENILYRCANSMWYR